MDKFLRNYFLTIEVFKDAISIPAIATETLTITLPFTLEFDIVRRATGSLNTASIRIYNLSEYNRNKVLKDAFDIGTFRKVTLQAGYGEGPFWPEIFTGTISQAWSVREKNNFITQIECFDGGFGYQNGEISRQYVEGTPIQSIIEDVIADMSHEGVKRGSVSQFPPRLISRGNSYSGSNLDVLQQLTGGRCFIDNGKVNCIYDDQYLSSEEENIIINSSNGLLGTPVREQAYLRFEILFEPKVFVGQRIRIESESAKNYNTFYKVFSVQHKGTISSAVCGDAVTTIEVFYGGAALTPV